MLLIVGKTAEGLIAQGFTNTCAVQNQLTQHVQRITIEQVFTVLKTITQDSNKFTNKCDKHKRNEINVSKLDFITALVLARDTEDGMSKLALILLE